MGSVITIQSVETKQYLGVGAYNEDDSWSIATFTNEGKTINNNLKWAINSDLTDSKETYIFHSYAVDSKLLAMTYSDNDIEYVDGHQMVRLVARDKSYSSPKENFVFQPSDIIDNKQTFIIHISGYKELDFYTSADTGNKVFLQESGVYNPYDTNMNKFFVEYTSRIG